MKVIISLLAVLALTTGFTCSKNPPPETAAPAQEQMAAPTDTTVPMEMPAEDVKTTTMHQ